MSTDREELFPLEFRHETVLRVVRGWVDGSIKFDLGKLEEGNSFVSLKLAELVISIKEYCNKHSHERMEELEKMIFSNYVQLKSVEYLVEDSFSISQMEREILNINKKLESNNALLSEVLKIIKAVLEELEDQ